MMLNSILGISLSLIVALVLTLSSSAAVALAQEGDEEDEVLPLIVDPVAAAEETNRLFDEVTFVQLLDEEYASVRTTCAGNGLNNIQPVVEGPIVLIPNAGDLSVGGSNVSVKLESNGEITFIPRTQGQLIRVPMNVGDKVEGQEVPSLSFDEAQQLMAAGWLVWTAKDSGPYGSGHGLAGHIAECDPLYNEEDFKKFEGIE